MLFHGRKAPQQTCWIEFQEGFWIRCLVGWGTLEDNKETGQMMAPWNFGKRPETKGVQEEMQIDPEGQKAERFHHAVLWQELSVSCSSVTGIPGRTVHSHSTLPEPSVSHHNPQQRLLDF